MTKALLLILRSVQYSMGEGGGDDFEGEHHQPLHGVAGHVS